jgi:lysozyme family protein
MSEAFLKAYAKTRKVEGGYSNNPNDAGGETMNGVTIAVARASGYHGPMRDLPDGVTHAVYKQGYWDSQCLDQIAERAPAVAEEMFDTGVNAGVSTSAKFLQIALNAFNRQGYDYPDTEVDGAVGPTTITLFKRYMDIHGALGETVMLRALNAQQGAFYLGLAKSRPANEAFEFGWFSHRVV